MVKISLNGKWHGRGYAPDGKTLDFEGTVPGCVHTDLERAGIIPPPLVGFNAEKCRWIEQWSWYYERTFDCDRAGDGAYLSFDGLDTVCDVYLNGVRVGSADDMHVPYAFPVGKALKKGENTLRVVFYPPVLLTRARPERGAAFTSERLYTRRMQCTYSWDWVGRFVTCGIFRDASLAFPGAADIDTVYVYTKSIDCYSAQIGFVMNFAVRGEGARAEYEISAPDGREIYRKSRPIVGRSIAEKVDIPSPTLWYPNGCGEHPRGERPLYSLALTVRESDGNISDRKTVNFGIRTVKILELPDIPGSESYGKCMEIKKAPHVSGENAFWDRNESFSGFTVVVNGVKILCKGANYVPCEPFPSAETDGKITDILSLAAESGMNTVRIWGGGIFERDIFYDTCDRLGLLVIQDFLMACGDYPEDDELFCGRLAEEAEHAAVRLRNHPSLAWWNGDNENGMDADESMTQYKGRKAANDIIAPVLRRLDPYRDFLPSSPYGGTPFGSVTVGTTHNTNYIGQWFDHLRTTELNDYREFFDGFLSRFCAEEPLLGTSFTSSLRKYLSDAGLYGADDFAEWRYHTKNNPSEYFRTFEIYDYMAASAEKLFGEASGGEQLVNKMQYLGYEWVRVTAELYRRNKFYSSGLIYWMLDDCWTGSVWALIDYYDLPKPGWYAMKRACRPVICSVTKRGGAYAVFVCNDSLAPIGGEADLFLLDTATGERVYEMKNAFSVCANSSEGIAQVPEGEILPYANESTILICEISGEGFCDRAHFFERRPRDVAFPVCRPEIVEQGDDFVTLRAEKYIHAVMLDGDFIFDDNCFSMLPGETRTVKFRRSKYCTSECPTVYTACIG
jgi:beta-mannosidase